MVLGKAYDIDGAYGAQCPARGTLIAKRDGRFVPVEELVVGDVLKGGNTVVSNKPSKAECLYVETELGSFTVSEDHRFIMADGSEKKAKDLELGDEIEIDRSKAHSPDVMDSEEEKFKFCQWLAAYEETYTCKDKKFLLGAQQVLAHAGLASTLSETFEEYGCSKWLEEAQQFAGDDYIVCIHSGYVLRLHQGKRPAGVVTSVEPAGEQEIWVLNVDGDHTYYAENHKFHNCWDGAMYYSKWLGYPTFHCTSTMYAQDIWTLRKSSGILNYYDEVEMMEPGDIAVFKIVDGWTPLSHIAIFDSDIDGTYGYFLGQNQGGPGMSFNLCKLPYSATYPTAFRPKCFTKKEVSKPVKDDKIYGLDLSAHNGNLDFNQIKNAGNSFVILRAGYGWSVDQKDPYFETYYKQAKAAGLHVGTYWYSYARNLNEAKQEAACFKKVIEGKSFDYGIWVDLEDADGWKANNGNPSGEMQAQCANLIAKEMKAAGYNVGIYCSTYYIDHIYKGLDIKNYMLWEANYGANDALIHSDHSNRAVMHQYTSQYKLGGKPFDRNVAYKDLVKAVIKTPPKPIAKEKDGSVYRFYNSTTGDHLYTLSHDEAVSAQNNGWGYEGVGWISPKDGKAVYRLFNPNNGVHHYCFEGEKDALVKAGWKAEGVAFKSGGDEPIYRLYNPNTGIHVLTASHKEHDSLVRIGWTCEGMDIRH